MISKLTCTQINAFMKTTTAQLLILVLVTHLLSAQHIFSQEQTLSYAVSAVKTEDFKGARETDVLQALQDKLSAVQISAHDDFTNARNKSTANINIPTEVIEDPM